jgi:propionyl-CoA synthetase
MSPSPAYDAARRRALEDRDAFWAEQAARIDWHRPWDRVCDLSRPPFARWFPGAETNLCHNAVDRHLGARGEQPALICVSTETPDAEPRERIVTYADLHREVQTMAATLLELGVQRGDRVLIYMPMIPEAVFAMLATVRIGAIHSVVFGGFASTSLANRIDDARPVVVVAADAGSRSGKVTAYKPLLDEAIRLATHKPRRVLLVDRGLAPMAMTEGRDVGYAALRERHRAAMVPCTWVESTAPSYTLYTSGTTGPSRRACNATPAATRSRSPQAWTGSSSASPARPTSAAATSAGSSATPTSSTGR